MSDEKSLNSQIELQREKIAKIEKGIEAHKRGIKAKKKKLIKAQERLTQVQNELLRLRFKLDLKLDFEDMMMFIKASRERKISMHEQSGLNELLLQEDLQPFLAKYQKQEKGEEYIY